MTRPAPREQPRLLADPGFAALRRYIVAQTGLHYYEERPADLAARLWGRMQAAGLRDAAAYLDFLRGSDEAAGRERTRLIDDIAIGETFFFRFAEQFRALQDHVLPDLLRSKAASKTLNIWSAGCANGAEAYSVSILLQRTCEQALRGWNVSILATDVNARAIERARQAVFTPWTLRTLDAQTRQDCFDALPSGQFRLRAPYREGVAFRVHNLLHAEPPAPEGGFDLVLCRNVLIYFSEDSIRQTLRRLTESLRPGGWLFLGHAEAAMVRGEAGAGLYAVSFPGTFLHRRGADAGNTTPPPPLWPPPMRPPAPGPPPVSRAIGLPSGAPPFVLPLLPEPAPPPPTAEAPPARAPSISRPRGETERDAIAEARAEVRRLLDVGDSWAAIEYLEPVLSADAGNVAPPRVGAAPRHDPVLHYYHALALEEQERLAEAEAALRRVLYLDRSFVLAHYHLALVAEARGDYRLAARSLDSVLRLVEGASGSSTPAAPRWDTLRAVGDITAEEMRGIAQLRRRRLPKEEGAGSPRA